MPPSYSELLSEADSARAGLQSAIASLKNGNTHVDGRPPSLADVVVTPDEVNELHGTGLLLLHIFPDSRSIVSLRARCAYPGEAVFGAARFCLEQKGASRAQIFSTVLAWLRDVPLRRVLCCPYLPEDVLIAIAVKEVFDIPLCTYIMDDHNVRASGIPDPLMSELIAKSGLRLVISPEMRQAYEEKYRRKFWLLPPLVPSELIRSGVSSGERAGPDSQRGVLIGNVWGQRWLDLLRDTFRGSGYQLDWYCNRKNPSSLTFDRVELERDGIRLRDALPPAELAAILPGYAYAVVTSGTLDEHSTPALQALAELSLPSRITFILATSQLPILVLGDAGTAAARGVERLQIGAVAPYRTDAVQEALQRLLQPETQAAIRGRAAALSTTFSAEGAADWIWRSLERGKPCDFKYEQLMPE